VPLLRIRDADAGDCEALSALAFTSKASWGYDDAFMEACRAELTILPENLRNARIRVAYNTDVEGFHGIVGDELMWLFVNPNAQQQGVGRALFEDACAIACEQGLRQLMVESDPNARGFYEHLGARLVGERPSSSIPGRVLPLYAIDVSSRS
jgi:GNAT superfamily N-acetyltransferase